MTAEDIDRVKNKSSLWMLAAGAFAIIAMAAYLIFALTLAEHMQSDPIPTAPTETTKPAM